MNDVPNAGRRPQEGSWQRISADQPRINAGNIARFAPVVASDPRPSALIRGNIHLHFLASVFYPALSSPSFHLRLFGLYLDLKDVRADARRLSSKRDFSVSVR